MIESKLLKALPHIRHGFFTREGGISGGIYESLNCGPGSKDDPEHVRENRARVAAAMEAATDALLTLYQVHSPDAVYAASPWNSDTRPEADAMVTGEKNLALGILTADCVPVLFADKEKPIVGAAHSGWKGAIGGVLESTLALMEEQGAKRERIIAAIGPAIRQKNYEVGAEFRDTFLKENGENARYFIPAEREAHFLFDLTGFVRRRLADAGIAQIDDLQLCTYEDPQRFFSFRRTTHRKEPDYGRQISVIRITPR